MDDNRYSAIYNYIFMKNSRRNNGVFSTSSLVNWKKSVTDSGSHGNASKVK
jgi:hypothetical protein